MSKTCFVCGQLCINTPYYPLLIAIKPRGNKKRKKNTGIIICENCYEYSPMGNLELDPWKNEKDEIIKELYHYRTIWKKLKNHFQNTKQYKLFELMQAAEKDK